MGISLQPLQESYATYGKWLTHSWLKSIWEKADKFNVTIDIATLPIEPPREGDKWFMQAAMEAGITNSIELANLNKYCCDQQVLHVSDVLDAGGKCLDKRYLNRCCKEENWSSLIFPTEKLPQGHILLWRQVLYAVVPRGRVQTRVGRFLNKGHKVWEWRYLLVWATELLLAAIGLVFPVLVLGYKSFNCSMYQMPVPTFIEKFVWTYFKQLLLVAGSIIF
jgi:hypothetical protein